MQISSARIRKRTLNLEKVAPARKTAEHQDKSRGAKIMAKSFYTVAWEPLDKAGQRG
jgi:hypothetical protein